MRISDASLYYRFLAGLDDRRGEISRAVDQLTDGKKVRTASDDPAGAHASLALRGRLVQIEGYDKSAQAARMDLSTMDSVLGEVGTLLSTSRTEAMAGSSGVLGDTNQSRADKIDSLRAELLSLANTEQNGRHLFAGTATQTMPFAADGTYSGNDAEVQAPVDPQDTVGATLAGNEVFKQPQDVFQLLSDLSQALRDNRQTDVAAMVPSLRTAIAQISAARADVGNRMSRIDDLLSRHQDEATRIAERIGQIEDVNLESAVVNLQAAQTSRAALSATAANVLGRSLFDYLG